ncbi:c02d74f2-3053-4a15-b0fa-f1806cd34706 [Sclerotinia trifoliorum]|uniref:C02d74f2-3053-4a15-b0fa-f1806cd34706 n=1 Tax=Sclerotinia trifoliorum TaxID=28548 RepID=A0A8H2W4N2_9HELO|nr:c02d74f2-3053-4a15-b0fa-f1806cd34706 [Sclerotinia trifoliorum]
MKVTTVHLATLLFGFTNYTTVNAQTKAQIVSSCQSQNPNNFIAATYAGDSAVNYPYSMCFPFEFLGNNINSALFCRDAHCYFYSDDACTTLAAFSIMPIPFIQGQSLPPKLVSSLGWKSAKCGSALLGFTVGQ